MQVYATAAMRFEEREQGLIINALTPYQAVMGKSEHPEFESLSRKVENPCNRWDLVALLRCLGNLRDALSKDVSFWVSEAGKVPESSEGILAKPQEAYLALAASRENQVRLAGLAHAMVRKALGILETWEKELKQIDAKYQP